MPPAQPQPHDSDADLDRFATLFSPATPPATPTLAATPPLPIQVAHTYATAHRSRTSTHGSTDSESDFGAFVSVPPSQDPLAQPKNDARNHTTSLVYFDQFTARAKTAAERQKREVLDELLEHQDDPLYFINTHPSAASNSNSTFPPDPIQIPMPTSTDDALAEALASEMTNPKLIRVERGGSVKVAPSPSRSLPPRLSGTASPPSTTTSPSVSSTSLAAASSASTSTSTLASTHPAHATLSRISSSLVSLIPSTRPRSTTPSIPPFASSSTLNSSPPTRFHAPSTALTHGSPFSATPYIPPTGAPGFAGDRAWDRGFSEVLEQEEKRGLIDPVGLGLGAGGTEMTTPAKHPKGKGVTLVGRREGTVGVLNETMADLIRPHLPALVKLPRHWTLLYSLDQHGISLNTLYTRCEPRVPSRAHPNPPKGGLVVVRDADEAVFGAWVTEGVRVEKGGYYGSGEAFLWRYHPPVPLQDDPDREREGQLDVYTWTGVNAYVALCEQGYISFGGGDGHYGLYLDASLLDGSSASCPTFGNPPLCGRERVGGKGKREVSFECVGLEVWGVGPG